MRYVFGMAAALALLSGCQSDYPDSPLYAATPVEARCAAIRSHVPFDQRGTSADPTVARYSQCAPAPRYGRAVGGGIESPLYPVRAVVDAATY